MTTKRTIALKRIANDMKDLAKCPLEGIGIAPIGNESMKFVVNIELMMGIYEGYKVQLLLIISDEYPVKPPKVLIYPGQMESFVHHHVFITSHENIYGYRKMCINFLDNDFGMNTNEEHSGWNPAYSISTILLQVQNFLSDPDLPKGHFPEKKKIEKLMEEMDDYQRTFLIEEENGTKEIIHTWKNPYPKMHHSISKIAENEIKMDNEEERKMQMTKENLTCYLLRDNYIENPEILLGYPIVQNKSLYGKIEIYPIPELLTYEAFKLQTSQSISNKNAIIGEYYNEQLKAGNNEFFNNWFPIYVNENHFFKNRETIINSLKSIKNESEFKPEQIFEILPIILNKMIIGMFNGKSLISSAFITCYFQYVLLFKKLCQKYNEEYEKYVNKKINLITMNDYEVNKKIVPDIGDFFMLIFLSNKDMNTPEMKKMKKVLIQEFLTRQIYWIFHGPECKENMKQKVMMGLKVNQSDEIYLDKFENDPDFKMKYLDIFNKELHRENIYKQIIDIISNDHEFLRQYNYNWKYAKKMTEERITQSFKKIYNECSRWSRGKIKEIIKEKMHFKEFFEVDENPIKKELYESFRVNEILKENKNENMNEILKYAYESQRGNQLLLITFFALKKIEEKGFLEDLEKNYGIYLKVDEFVKELKEKLKEIKSYKSLYEYIGTEFGRDKTEIDIIIEGYERAKKQRYIKEPNEKIRNYNNNNDGRGYNKRVRGRGRGYRYGYHNQNGYGYGDYW